MDEKRITLRVPENFHRDIKTELSKNGLTFKDTVCVFFNVFLDLGYSAKDLNIDEEVFEYLKGLMN